MATVYDDVLYFKFWENWKSYFAHWNLQSSFNHYVTAQPQFQEDQQLWPIKIFGCNFFNTPNYYKSIYASPVTKGTLKKKKTFSFHANFPHETK